MNAERGRHTYTQTDTQTTFVTIPAFRLAMPNAALTSETKQRKTIPQQIQNNVLFQTLVHVKQNTELIPQRFGIVSELFQSCFGLISIFIRTSKNTANAKTVSASGM